MGATSEGFNGFENAFLKLFEGTFKLAGEEFLESRDAETSPRWDPLLRDPVAEQHQSVPGSSFRHTAVYSASGTRPTG